MSANYLNSKINQVLWDLKNRIEANRQEIEKNNRMIVENRNIFRQKAKEIMKKLELLENVLIL